ncbi:protein phosphatase 1 regulatory subunit 15A [Artibeus jamaicensis]|uniref:protein phosphatase 1 regulatory subunit 15A n=1 Tax=Artibeus jamaicensis TaxID=9417 RepID=UPI00235A4C16|nr:protein phosphatase 1 regulatory subunit 15A [Artibeus jamaicensis]
MAPRQVPHQLPWRDAHPFFLLSPLMTLLSRAWSRLRGSGHLKPWLVEAVRDADQGAAGLQGEAEAALATCYAPGGGHPSGVAEGSGDAVESGGESSWMACPALKANSSLLQAWELPDDCDEEYGGEEAASGPTEQESEYVDGQPAPSSPSLLKTLRDPPGEEESEDGGVAEDKAIMFSFPPSHWGSCPEMEEEGDGEGVSKETPSASTSPLSLGPKPRAWVYCAGEAEAPAKEEGRTENKEARKTSTSSSFAGSHPIAWQCCSGEESEEEGEAKGPSSIPPTSTFLRAWVYRPGEDTEDEEEEEEEDSDSGAAEEEEEAEGPSSIPPTSTFLRAWVYRPGEDTEDEEEEEEDSDSGAAEEEEEAEGPSSIPPTSTFLRAWVYRPGEDTEDEEEEEEEDMDSRAAEDEGEAEGPSSIPPTSTFLRAWVYRPGEDTEDEEEEEEDSDSGAAEEEGEAEGPSSISSASAFLRSWVYRPGEDSEDDDEVNEKDGLEEAAGSEPGSSIQAQSSFFRGWRSAPGKETEGGEAEPHPFRVAIYLPGEKPPPPWALPRLPARLQRRLKSAETPTRHLDPETPQKTTKVRFSEKVSVHFLVVWAGPAQAARHGPWEQFARDRSRFARRIAQAEEVLGPCFTPAARAKAWARLRNPSPPLVATPATTQALPTSCVQATPLSHTVIFPFPIYVALPPCLDLSWRRG